MGAYGDERSQWRNRLPSEEEARTAFSSFRGRGKEKPL
jgi:hypothetical protein